MDMRQVKTDMGLFFVAETDQLCCDLFIFQEGELVFSDGLPQVLAGIIIKVVIVAQAMFIQQLEYGFTPLATKLFLFDPDR